MRPICEVACLLEYEGGIEKVDWKYFVIDDTLNSCKQFLEIFPLNKRTEMLKKILKIYKNSISIDVEDYNLAKDSVILKNFFKSVELYTNIIDNYLELIAKK